MSLVGKSVTFWPSAEYPVAALIIGEDDGQGQQMLHVWDFSDPSTTGYTAGAVEAPEPTVGAWTEPTAPTT